MPRSRSSAATRVRVKSTKGVYEKETPPGRSGGRFRWSWEGGLLHHRRFAGVGDLRHHHLFAGLVLRVEAEHPMVLVLPLEHHPVRHRLAGLGIVAHHLEREYLARRVGVALEPGDERHPAVEPHAAVLLLLGIEAHEPLAGPFL